VAGEQCTIIATRVRQEKGAAAPTMTQPGNRQPGGRHDRGGVPIGGGALARQAKRQAIVPDGGRVGY